MFNMLKNLNIVENRTERLMLKPINYPELPLGKQLVFIGDEAVLIPDAMIKHINQISTDLQWWVDKALSLMPKEELPAGYEYKKPTYH